METSRYTSYYNFSQPATTTQNWSSGTNLQQPGMTGMQYPFKEQFSSQKVQGWMNTMKNWWGDVSRNLTHVGYDITKGVGKVLHQDQMAEERFRTYFRLPPQEQLLSEFACRLLSGSNVLEGYCYISFNYFCFAPLVTFSKPASGQMMLITIPLKEIENIQACLVSPSYVSGIPVIQPVTNPMARPDALQVITRDRAVYNFFGFFNFIHTFNVLFHSWKSCDVFSSISLQQLQQHGYGIGSGQQSGQQWQQQQLGSGGNVAGGQFLGKERSDISTTTQPTSIEVRGL